MLTLPTEYELYRDEEHGLRLCVRGEAGEDFRRHLAGVRFGTTGVRYRRLNIDEQLERLADAVFLELLRDDRLLGTYVLAQRPVHMPGGPAAGIYRGLLTLAEEAQGQGLGRLLARSALDLVADRSEQQGVATLSWGCIDAGNQRSLKLLESLGARPAGELESLLVYRQWPRRRAGVEVLGEAERSDIESALAETYADCALRPSLAADAPYYALTDDRGIVAGARAALTRVDMRTGSILERGYAAMLKLAPPARRRYDPGNFTYLRLSDVVIREGRETAWRDLLTTLLAEHDAHMAMFLLDPRSKARRLLDASGLPGRFSAATRQRVIVMTQAFNAPATLGESLQKPLAVGPLDI